ncbi:MAG: hypothetical protein WCC27_05300, partial [Acidobacteriaceae bacterium]
GAAAGRVPRPWHGIRRGPHTKYRRARSGWDSLTMTEVKLAVLVKEGLPNPEIATRLLLSQRAIATRVPIPKNSTSVRE